MKKQPRITTQKLTIWKSRLKTRLNSLCHYFCFLTISNCFKFLDFSVFFFVLFCFLIHCFLGNGYYIFVVNTIMLVIIEHYSYSFVVEILFDHVHIFQMLLNENIVLKYKYNKQLTIHVIQMVKQM